MALKANGDFYPAFTANNQRYTKADKTCIEKTVTRLVATETSAARPGMLLGKIQSGKTKAFLGIIALAFDNQFDVAIVLTKGTKALAQQTLQRIRGEFAPFCDKDQLQIFDILTVPSGLTRWELNQKIIVIAKKQSDNLERLATLFRETYPQLASKRVLIVDDEADFASVGFRKKAGEGISANITTQQIDSLRTLLKKSAFLQVTATPYALYLQPDGVVVGGSEFKPIRPAFTELVPINQSYVGGEYYFDKSKEAQSVASYIYQPVTREELEILRRSDRRRFKVEECLTSDAIPMLRSAICNFVVGGIIRRLQDEKEDLPPKKFSFLVHTEAQRAAHEWQEEVVTEINERLTDAASSNPRLLRSLFKAAYDDLANSIQALKQYLPPLDEVLREAIAGMGAGWLMITKVNSERQVEELLDDQGQLRLRTPLNVFIGGQILDRGVTISNLIGFFYGRRPQVHQQDTVLQHSRMFGFRPLQDLTVTRFYTEPGIHDAMQRMHESDVALRESFEKDPDQPVVFIQRDDGGRIIPCSPNKILISNTTTLRPHKRILPIGFQTDYAVRTKPIVEAVDRLLDKVAPAKDFDEPFEISIAQALDLLERIEPTILMEENEGYSFDWDAARAALNHLANASTQKSFRGRVWCLVRRDRNLSRKVAAGSHAVYADAPDTTRTEGGVARRVAVEFPMLMLIRQNGQEKQGWRGTPFYWPVIWAQRNLRTAIFAHETEI